MLAAAGVLGCESPPMDVSSLPPAASITFSPLTAGAGNGFVLETSFISTSPFVAG